MFKMPLFKDNSALSSLNELLGVDLIITEKVTEYGIEVEEEFNMEQCSHEELLMLCNASHDVTEHHFITTTDNYDVI